MVSLKLPGYFIPFAAVTNQSQTAAEARIKEFLL